MITKKLLIKMDKKELLGNVAYNFKGTGIYVKVIRPSYVFGFYLSNKGKKYFKLKLHRQLWDGRMIAYFRFWDGKKYYLKMTRLVKLYGEGVYGPTRCKVFGVKKEVNNIMTMNSIFDWGEVLKNVDDSEKYEIDGDTIKSTLLGSVFDLLPSGNYYTFANSNVTLEEVRKDEEFWERLESEASEYGLFVFCGEGDPTIIFAGKIIDRS
jgi:hypothetical protein